MIEIQERAKSESEAALEKNANDHKEFNDEVTAWSAAIAAFCTFLLVIVGGFGVCYAIRTLRAIEKQAGLLEVQAALTEASMTQWVSVANWKASITQRVGPLSHQPKELLVEFEIANESNLPLTMQATFRFFGNLPNAARFRTLDDFVLFPRKPYSPSVALNITDEQSKEYVEGGLRIAVHGQITHVGAANQRSPLMDIRGNLVCRSSEPARLEYENIRMIPISPKQSERDQKPK